MMFVYLAAQRLSGRLTSAATSLRVLLSAAHPLSAAAKATLYFSLKLKPLHSFNERIITRSAQRYFPSSALRLQATRSCPHQSIIGISAASSLLQNPTFVLLRAQGLRTASQQLFVVWVFFVFFLIPLCVSAANSHRHYTNAMTPANEDPAFREWTINTPKCRKHRSWDSSGKRLLFMIAQTCLGHHSHADVGKYCRLCHYQLIILVTALQQMWQTNVGAIEGFPQPSWCICGTMSREFGCPVPEATLAKMQFSSKYFHFWTNILQVSSILHYIKPFVTIRIEFVV